MISESRGVWGKAVNPPGMVALNKGAEGQTVSVSCPRAGYCTAGGYYTSVNAHSGPGVGDGWLIDEKNGRWGTAKPVPGIKITPGNGAVVSAVSCWAPGNCTAGGYLSSYGIENPQDVSDGQAFIATEVNGTWHAAKRITGMASITLLSCQAAGRCVAAGYGTIQNQCPINFGCPGAYVTEKNGTWGGSRLVLSQTAALTTSSPVTALSCPSAGNCVLAGGFGLLEEKNGSWLKPRPVPGAPGGAAAVSCPAAGNCDAGGTYGTNDGFVISEVRGTWGRARVEDFGPVGVVSCFSATSCAALVGEKTLPLNSFNGAMYAGVMNKAVIQGTRTVLSTSAGLVTYGHEQAERVTVKVSSGLGTPGGTVLVGAGQATACVIGLVGGHGSCTLPPTALTAGTHTLTGYYVGQALFRPSVSAGHAVTVLKDGTTTSLSLSAARVSFGHEHSERLTVSLRARFGGPPTGKVTVHAGASTVCVITLLHGAGSCLLGASQLAPGAYQLSARYPGGTSFLASTSPKHDLTVTK
jgi:hypothetical protein